MTNLERLNAYRTANGMEAIAKFRADRHQEFLDSVVAPWEQKTAWEAERAAYVEMAKKMDLTKLDAKGIEGHCPHCGIDHLSNGMWSVDDAEAHQKRDFKYTYECLGCGGEWGPVVQHGKASPDRHSGTGLQIEKNRESRNGVKRPSAGGKCRQVWDALDEFRASKKTVPTVSDAKAIATEAGWNVSNAAIEFYQWRKFNGIKGR